MFEAAIAIDATRRAKAPTTRRKAPPTTKAGLLAQRQATVEFLGEFAANTPRLPADATGRRKLGVLIAHGYLKRKGDGFVRTAKPYHIDPKAAT